MFKNIRNLFSNNGVIIWNIFSLWTLQLFNYIIPLITLPYILKTIWPEKFGIIAFILAFVWYFSILINYGFNYTATRDISINRNNKGKISEIFWTVIFTKCMLWLISLFLILLITSLFTILRSELLIVLFTFLWVIWEIFFPVWFFQWVEKMKFITIVNVCIKTLFLAPIFYFINESKDYIIIPLITSISFFLSWSIAFAIAIIKFKVQFYLPTTTNIITYLREGWEIFISTVFISLYTTSTAFILGIFSTSTIVWYYASAEKIVRAVQWLIWPISQAIYPDISKKVMLSKEKTIVFLNKVIILVSIYAIILSFLLFFWAEYLVNVLSWSEFKESIIVIKILSFLPLIVGVWNIILVVFMFNYWFKKQVSYIIITCSLISITLSVPLSFHFQHVWMAISVLITESIITLSAIFEFIKIRKMISK